MTPSFALAFLAGLLSFLSPCVLPLVPSYVGFLTGLTLEELEIRRGTALVHALWFVAGFSLVFVALGATASALGVWLVQSQVWIGRGGGVLVILFGLYLLGLLRPGFLMRERRVQLARKPVGYLGSAVVGVTFGAAWTPCIGPILGALPPHRAGARSVSRLVPAVPALSRLGRAGRRHPADRARLAPRDGPLHPARELAARADARVPEAQVVILKDAGSVL